MNLKHKKSILKAVIQIGLLTVMASANAELIIRHGPSLIAGTEYHSNIQLSENDKESVYLFTIAPEYNVTALDGKNEWFGNIGLVAERSSNSTVSSNREDPFGNIGWKRLLENGMVGLTAAYAKESTRDTLFTETGVVTQDGTSVTRALTGDYKRAITQRLDLALQGRYEKIKFADAAGLSNFEYRYIHSDFFYKLNEKIRPFARFGINDFRSNDINVSNHIKYQDYLLGASVLLNPRFAVSAGVGITHFSRLGNSTNSDKNPWVGIMNANYKGNKYTVTGGLSRSVEPVSVGDIQIEDGFDTTYIYNLTRRSRLGGSMALTQNIASNFRTQEVIGFYRRDLTNTWKMELTAGFRNQKNEGTNSINDNVLGINFTYRYFDDSVVPQQTSPFKN